MVRNILGALMEVFADRLSINDFISMLNPNKKFIMKGTTSAEV